MALAIQFVLVIGGGVICAFFLGLAIVLWRADENKWEHWRRGHGDFTVRDILYREHDNE